VVLCKTLKFFCKVLQTLGGSTEQRLFSGFEVWPHCLFVVPVYLSGRARWFYAKFSSFFGESLSRLRGSTEQRWFWEFTGDRKLCAFPESAGESIPRLIAEVL
jgi:hypothetical protein